MTMTAIDVLFGFFMIAGCLISFAMFFGKPAQKNKD